VAAQLLFFYFAGMILVSAVAAVASPNLIYSALALLITFIHVAGVYILLNAEFIAAVQVIVYAGAILVLYLFVLMLFNPEEERRYWHAQWPVGLFLTLVILGLMVFAAFRSDILGPPGDFTVAEARRVGHTQAIGRALFTDFVFPFEIASFILLVAMLGAIILAGRGTSRHRSLPAQRPSVMDAHALLPTPAEGGTLRASPDTGMAFFHVPASPTGSADKEGTT
jgi:NADH-quinone oxidoreductase subunit J